MCGRLLEFGVVDYSHRATATVANTTNGVARCRRMADADQLAHKYTRCVGNDERTNCHRPRSRPTTGEQMSWRSPRSIEKGILRTKRYGALVPTRHLVMKRRCLMSNRSPERGIPVALPSQPDTARGSAHLLTPSAPTWQRALLAACILLAPLSITLYLVAWTGSGRQPFVAAAMADSTGNALRLIGAVAASFFLPLGYLGMSLLGMRRAPTLAFICAALSLIGWIPWAALIVLDDLAITIDQTGNTPELAALWAQVNGDPVMTTFLLIYIIGHLLSAVLIGYLLGRLRVIPVWAAWAFALTSPLTILIFPVHNAVFQETLKYSICVLLFIGAVPAAYAMLRGRPVRQR